MFRFPSIIRDAVGLDILDCNYLVSSEELGFLEFDPIYPRRTFFQGIKAFFSRLVGTRSSSAVSVTSSAPKVRELFFVCTSNEIDAVEPLLKQCESPLITGIPDELEEKFSSIHRPFPLHSAHWWAVPFLPLVVWNFLTAHGYRRRSFYHAFQNYWTSYGLYITSRHFLSSLSPKVVVLPNDHTFWARVFHEVARAEDIPSVYVQHASVTKNFPPLTHDFAFLNGPDAYYKYTSGDNGDTETRIVLTGSPKFDRFNDQANKNGVEAVALCVNRPDDPNRVKKLCEKLRERFPEMTLVIRPHPRESHLERWETWGETFELEMSYPSDELCFEMLRRVDVSVACETSVHLEAALMNVYPLYGPFMDEVLDRYDYVKNGLVDLCRSPEEVVDAIGDLRSGRPHVRDRARYYCVNVNSPSEGKSGELMLRALESVAETDGSNLETAFKRFEPPEGPSVYLPRDVDESIMKRN